jgi:Ca-activated chloride channel family protein
MTIRPATPTAHRRPHACRFRERLVSTRWVAAVALFLTFAGIQTPARADGFIVIHTPPTGPRVPGHFSFAPLEVTYHRVNVEVTDSVAVTSVDQEFYNPNDQRLEGTYLFPLPEGTHVDKFSMDVNGKMMEAELLDADKARSIYEDIVRKAKDPALLEYAGRSAFKVRIFPIEPHSRKPVKITYTQVLKTDAGLTEYVYPLNTEKFSSRPLREVSVRVAVNCKDPIKSLYCPSHAVDVRRDGDRRATLSWDKRDVRPDTDFKVMFSRSDKPVGVELLTYRTGSDDGYFMLLASPGMDAPKGQVQKKDVCFVIDTSGSMAENGGKKMEQAKKALSFCLQNLNDGDRFEVVRFSTEAEPLFNELRLADKANVDKAQDFVRSLRPIGGTAIGDAMGKAMELRGKRGGGDEKGDRRGGEADRPYVVIFLTDGQPTIGETNEDALVTAVNRSTGGTTRVFTFGIGTDVNTHLLDRIATGTRAASQYVLPDEDLEVKLSSFYTKIKEPVLANLDVSAAGGDVRVSGLYPNQLPDLFKGEQLVAFGRYSGRGPAAVKIRGTLNGERREFVQDVTFADQDARQVFIPRLWATRRVGFLLDEIRLHGESRELKDEVTRLAREHGIVTPYTAFLILEDEARRGVPVASQTLRDLLLDRPAAARAALKYDSNRAEAKDSRQRAGEKAVANAVDVDQLKQMSNLEDQQQRGQQDLAKQQYAAGPAVAGVPTAGGVPTTPLPAAATPPAAAPTTDPAGGGAGGGAGGPVAEARPGERPATAGRRVTVEELDRLRKLEVASGAFRDPAGAAAKAVGYKVATNYAQQARVVNGRAFYQNGNTWTDATAQALQAKNAAAKLLQVKFNSDEYFALLKKYPEAAQWLALGDEVDVVLGDTLYQVRG